MPEPSIFTKIINGEIACHKVYEDDQTFCFLDIHPKQPGHVLVISKKQVDHLWDLTDEEYTAMFQTVKRVADRIRQVLQPSRVGLQVEGIDVPHVHIHVFPFNTGEEFRALQNMDQEPDHDQLSDMAKRLAF